MEPKPNPGIPNCPQPPSRPPRVLHVRAADREAAKCLGPYQITSLIPVDDEAAATAYLVKIGPRELTSVSYHLVAEELYFVVEGSGVAILDGVEYELSPGDFLRLPPGVHHGFRTAETPLVMLDVHTPGSRPDRDVYFEGGSPPGFGAA